MSAENWHVYLILCENGALYCGISNRPQERFAAHLQRQTEAAFGQAADGGKMRTGNAVGDVEKIAFAAVLQGRAHG